MSSPKGSRRGYPDPLQPGGVFNPGSHLLPASLISILSLFALVSVTALLTETQDLWINLRLRLPGFAAGLMAGAAMLLGWMVVWRCSGRPGRLWPRLWTTCLVLTSTAVAPLALLYAPQFPFLFALSCGLLSATLLLLARLVRLHPDSRWMGRLPLLMMILLVLWLVLLTVGIQSAFAAAPVTFEEAVSEDLHA